MNESGLAGRRVALLSDGDWVGPTRELLAAAGCAVEVAPLIGVAPGDLNEVFDAAEKLRRGAFQWLVVTSPRAIHALVAAAGSARIPEHTKVAAVGDGTAAALAEYGIETHFIPTEHTARALIAQWPDHRDELRVLWPHSAIARTTIADGFAEFGAAFTDVVAYRPVARTLPVPLRSRLLAGEVDAVVVSSGSIARELAAQVPELATAEGAALTKVVSFGPITTSDAEDAGLRVDAEAASKHPQAVVDAVGAALQADDLRS
ncbi:uroporphyrinogen-III synthase [Gulosibacter bifidus]|uniref:Uroporphyrinogen-III synthase n=1 Tax=Gulosibacter bifidus TaxID=272239 RepID=A0ABW5RJL5_9MICO|nr:uroporphyrinogen-III synthase [Gulosibacter bifidus]